MPDIFTSKHGKEECEYSPVATLIFIVVLLRSLFREVSFAKWNTISYGMHLMAAFAEP